MCWSVGRSVESIADDGMMGSVGSVGFGRLRLVLGLQWVIILVAHHNPTHKESADPVFIIGNAVLKRLAAEAHTHDSRDGWEKIEESHESILHHASQEHGGLLLAAVLQKT